MRHYFKNFDTAETRALLAVAVVVIVVVVSPLRPLVVIATVVTRGLFHSQTVAHSNSACRRAAQHNAHMQTLLGCERHGALAYIIVLDGGIRGTIDFYALFLRVHTPCVRVLHKLRRRQKNVNCSLCVQERRAIAFHISTRALARIYMRLCLHVRTLSRRARSQHTGRSAAARHLII